MPLKTLVFASSNKHKLDEIREILPAYIILGLKDAGINHDIPETGNTLEENAILKARYLFSQTGKISLAEDTGLEVACLSGRPGVHTARFAGDEKDPDRNMDKLLNLMAGISDRKAQFRTVIALVNGNELKTFEGIIAGNISLDKSGVHGFGYDPIFIPDGYSQTFASLEKSIKNSISHRAKAVNKLIEYLSLYYI